MFYSKSPLFVLLPLLLAFAQGCDSGREETNVRSEEKGVQVTGDLEFFCDWEDEVSAFNMAAADYALGNRRTLDAWVMLGAKGTEATVREHESYCWQGALLYLGAFGSRAEIGPLLQLAANDPMLTSETSDAADFSGVSKTGMYRSVSHRFVYIAIAIQVLRQVLFDGKLDSAGGAAQEVLEACASDADRCMKLTPMHPSRRRDLQREAIRGLGITARPSGLAVLQEVAMGLALVDTLVPYAVGDARRLKATIEKEWSAIKQAIPSP